MGRLAAAKLARAAQALASGPLGALALVLVATGLHLALAPWFPRLTPFSLYYPAILASAVMGGWAVASFSALMSVLLSWAIVLRTFPDPMDRPSELINLLIFLLVGVSIAAVGSWLRGLLKRRSDDIAKLAERELHYRTLFEGMSDAYALLEGVWSPDGQLQDFILVEANPALLRWFEADTSVVGKRVRDLRVALPPGYVEASERALKGETVEFSFETPRLHRWLELRLSRVGENRLALIVVDITARKAAERRQTELFDELNHRVKNNLAMVSAMLGMQARIAESAEVREHLQSAVRRIQTIAEVHGSLYRTNRKDDVDFQAYLQHLCERLATSVVDPARMRIEVSAEPAVLSLNDAVALGLVVNELVANAAKHAYPAGDGVVRVLLRDTPEGLRLTVSDDGQGFQPHSGRPGLGMRLVRSLVQQCGGVLRVQPPPGAEFTVELPPTAARRPREEAQSQLL